MLVTHTGKNYYLSAPTLAERDEWILHVKRALECAFVNEDVFPFKPCKIIQERPRPSPVALCHRTKNPIAHMSSATFCKSCGRAYSSSEYVSDLSTISQLGQEELEKVTTTIPHSAPPHAPRAAGCYRFAQIARHRRW